jgi:hypothetical protein
MQQPGRAKKVKSALLRRIQNTLGKLPEMLAATSGSRGGSVAGGNNADGDASGQANREQEMMMMMYNAQVMGTMAATDINVPDVVMPQAAADGLFMA